MKRLHVTNFGPIRDANIEFGDLTVLVGPQATGKSLFVQLVKALEDARAIRTGLNAYGFDWRRSKNVEGRFCGIYFGGGFDDLVGSTTTVRRDGKAVRFASIAKPHDGVSVGPRVFLVPAQRVLVLQDGWPKPFMAYASTDPYSIREFSETLRLLLEHGMDGRGTFFPQPKRLTRALESSIGDAIFSGGRVHEQTDGVRRQVVLTPAPGAMPLAFGAWSAGQREFTPLLLGLYWLLAPGRSVVKTVIVEEPEMGLHPQAVVSFGLLVLELMARGYRVVVSTHSQVILDLVWAIRSLASLPPRTALAALAEIFAVEKAGAEKVLRSALAKSYRTFYFDRSPDGVVTRDISSLDPGAADADIAGWGGLSGFSGRIADVVGSALREAAE